MTTAENPSRPRKSAIVTPYTARLFQGLSLVAVHNVFVIYALTAHGRELG